MVDHIAYLLFRHDCVIVPGLGAFIARRVSSRMADDGVTMLPPSRTLAFNPDIVHNDGLLATSMARANETSYDRACNLMSSEIESLRHQLVNDGEIHIPRVGSLREGADNLISFVPDPKSTAALPYSLLEPVAVKLLSAEEPETEENIARVASPRRWIKNVSRVAACLALTLTIGLLCSTPRLVDEGTVNMASVPTLKISAPTEAVAAPTKASERRVMRFFLSSPSEADRGIEVVDTLQQQKMRDKLMAAERLAQAEAKQKPSKASPSRSGLRFNAADRYCIVVGSFESLRRAEKYIASRPGDTLSVLNQDGRYRVIAGSASSEELAKSIAGSEKIQRIYPGAWVTQK